MNEVIIMDAELTLEKYCNKKGIDINKYSEDQWDEMVDKFQNEIDGFLKQQYENGTMDMFLNGLL